MSEAIRLENECLRDQIAQLSKLEQRCTHYETLYHAEHEDVERLTAENAALRDSLKWLLESDSHPHWSNDHELPERFRPYLIEATKKA